MSFWEYLKGFFSGSNTREEPVDEFADVVCWNGNVAHYRHLYKGARFCIRGCGAENKDYRHEPVAVPTEGV